MAASIWSFLALAPYQPHVQGVAQDEGDVLGDAQVGEPVPGVGALGANHQAVAEGGDGAAEGVGVAGQVLVLDDGAGLVEDAQVHGPGVQIDAAVESVLRGVEPHRGLRVRGTVRWGVATSSIPAEKRP